MITTDCEIIISRILDAPQISIWKAWTEPNLFMQWWGPKKYTAPACKIDFCIGGKYLACMRSSEGRDYWSTGIYKKIVPFYQIVFTDNFADENGNIVPASYYGMTGDWQGEAVVTVTLENLGSKTKLTLTHIGIPAGEMSEMCTAGWIESFDKLADSLK
jgi:uncharacterized protein YndB with AHSA1/START domain